MDYVLVGHTVWEMLKKTFGGGPEIPFFLANNERIVDEYEIPKEQNFIYHQHYMYGYPDKNPEYVNIEFETKDISSGSFEIITIPYRMLLSKILTPKAFLYYCANKLKVNVEKLSLEIIPEEGETTEMTSENDGMMLAEIS